MKLKSEKSVIRIYFNNFIAYFIFNLFKLIFGKKTTEPKNNILFINSGQIGDLVVSSLLFENEDKLPGNLNFYFAFKNKFTGLFTDYKGRINLLPYSYYKYKYNPIYKYSLLKKFHSLNAVACYNLTAARGIQNDEMALLSGAKGIFCTDNSWKYLKKLFGKKMDLQYDEVMFTNVQNEYTKHIRLITKRFHVKLDDLEFKNRFTFKRNPELISTLPKGYLTMAPFSSIREKSWPLYKFKELTEKLNDRKFVILGTTAQGKIISKEFGNAGNVLNCCGDFKLNEVASIIYDSSFHIGNDSGLTHIALKLGVPFASVIGGYNFNKFFPFVYDGMIGRYFFVPLKCFGCEWNCIYDRAKCLTDVPVEDVYIYVSRMLKELEGK